jgi:hypothetical protein
MKYRSLLLCLSILVMVFAGCSSQSSDEATRLAIEQALAEERASVAEHAKAEEQSRIAAEQAQNTQKALALAEQALAEARRTNSAQAKAAEELKAKAEAEHTKATEEAARLAAEKTKAEEQAKAAAERAAAKQSRSDARQQTTLAAGTPIKVITSSEISTKTARTGDAFTALLNEDITDGGRVIAKRGDTVKGLISDSDPGGRVKGVAAMTLTLSSLTLANGSEVAIKTGDFNVDANSSIGKDATKTGIGAGIGAAIGAIAGGGTGAAVGAGVGGAAGAITALVTRGDPAVVPSETPITFNLTSPLTINQQQQKPQGGRQR